MLTTVAQDLESAYQNPNVLVRELLHKAAFTGTAEALAFTLS